jgi:hypothetical protein
MGESLREREAKYMSERSFKFLVPIFFFIQNYGSTLFSLGLGEKSFKFLVQIFSFIQNYGSTFFSSNLSVLSSAISVMSSDLGGKYF